MNDSDDENNYSSNWAVRMEDKAMRVRELLAELQVEEQKGWGDSGPPQVDDVIWLYDHIPGLFQPCIDNWPAPYMSAGALEALDAIAPAGEDDGSLGIGILNDTAFTPAAISGKLSDWKGDAADVFEDEYPDKMGTIRDNQVALTGALRGALEAHTTMFENARIDLEEVADGAINTLNQLIDNSSAADRDMLLAVVAGAITIASAGTGTVALSIASATLAVGREAIAQNGGQDTESVMEQIESDINTITTQISEDKDQLVELLEENLSLVQANRDDFEFPNPGLAGAESLDDVGDDFVPADRF